jgi:hypothetical protein
VGGVAVGGKGRRRRRRTTTTRCLDVVRGEFGWLGHD